MATGGVARQFLPQRHLIGPVLFPIYELVLKILGAVFIAPLLVWLGCALFSPAGAGPSHFII